MLSFGGCLWIVMSPTSMTINQEPSFPQISSMLMRVCLNGIKQVGIGLTLIYQIIMQWIENQRMDVKSCDANFKLAKNLEDQNAHLAALGSDGTCLTHRTQVELYLLQP